MKEKARRITPKYNPSDIKEVINAESWKVHFDQLYKGYCHKYNSGNHSKYITGGWKLHELYFSEFKKYDPSNTPSGPAKELIIKKFKNWSNFRDKFEEEASKFHGSGWIYLSTDGKIKTIELHEPRTDVAVIVDLWEHAYLDTFESKRAKYIRDFWRIVDWEVVSSRITPNEKINENASTSNLRQLNDFINKL